MKIIEVYETLDGKRFDSYDKAHDHCAEMAHRVLVDLIKSAGTKYAAHDEAYKLAQDVVTRLLNDPSPARVLAGWLEDAESSDRDADDPFPH